MPSIIERAFHRRPGFPWLSYGSFNDIQKLWMASMAEELRDPTTLILIDCNHSRLVRIAAVRECTCWSGYCLPLDPRTSIRSGASSSACLLSAHACLCVAPATSQPVARAGIRTSGKLSWALPKLYSYPAYPNPETPYALLSSAPRR